MIAADVADPHDVARLLAAVQADLPPLAGIVHALTIVLVLVALAPLANVSRLGVTERM